MRPNFAALLLFMGLGAGAAPARDLQVEVEVLHVGGMLTAKELESLLADARLNIEAGYAPTRLVEGVTARRERTMPLGSKLSAIHRQLQLQGAQVERQGRVLRFRASDEHPEHAGYRLNALQLRTPIANGLGRPQPDLTIDLLNPVPKGGVHETALYTRHGAFDLGLRLRYRWSDAQGAATVADLTCSADIRPLGNGQYRFRPRHPLAGLTQHLGSGSPARRPAGERTLRLREPFPEPLAGMKLANNELLQTQVDGQSVEVLSLFGEQAGPGHCRRSRAYNAFFAGGQLVTLRRSVHEDECAGEDIRNSHSVEAGWLADGSLDRYQVSTPKGSRAWDGFSVAAAARCDLDASPPPASEVQSLIAEMQRLRDAFVRP